MKRLKTLLYRYKIIIGILLAIIILTILTILNATQFSNENVVPNINEEVESTKPTNYPSESISPSPLISSVITKVPTPTPAYDGTRTGSIIDYTERCTGKKIKIYSNEQIKYVDSFGKSYLLTMADIYCLVQEQCLSLKNDFSSHNCPNSDYQCQISELQKRFTELSDKISNIINSYYNWKFTFCKSETSCKKNAESERNTLKEKCSLIITINAKNL
jgi:hypothetical protein